MLNLRSTFFALFAVVTIGGNCPYCQDCKPEVWRPVLQHSRIESSPLQNSFSTVETPLESIARRLHNLEHIDQPNARSNRLDTSKIRWVIPSNGATLSEERAADRFRHTPKISPSIDAGMLMDAFENRIKSNDLKRPFLKR